MCASNQIRFLKYRKSTLCVAGPCYGSCEALLREDVSDVDFEGCTFVAFTISIKRVSKGVRSFYLSGQNELTEANIKRKSAKINWLDINELSLNINKTKFMIFHTLLFICRLYYRLTNNVALTLGIHVSRVTTTLTITQTTRNHMGFYTWGQKFRILTLISLSLKDK